jgi:hypothetical protein
VYTSSYAFTPDKIDYEETDEKKTNAIHCTFTKITGEKTGLTIDLYLKSNPVMLTFFNLFGKKKMKKMFEQSLTNLKEFMKGVKIPALVD